VIRSLSFESETPDSLFKQFSLLGYEDGDIYLDLTMSEALYEKGKLYLESLVFEGAESIFSTRKHCLFRKANDKQKIFRIIKVFNQVPKNSLLELLISSPSWKLITPLTPKEVREIETIKYKSFLSERNTFLETLIGGLFRRFIFDPKNLP